MFLNKTNNEKLNCLYIYILASTLHHVTGWSWQKVYQNATFPLCIYGAQDTYSGPINFQRIWATNSDHKIIGRFYLDYLYECRGKVPTNLLDLFALNSFPTLKMYLRSILVLDFSYYIFHRWKNLFLLRERQFFLKKSNLKTNCPKREYCLNYCAFTVHATP